MRRPVFVLVIMLAGLILVEIADAWAQKSTGRYSLAVLNLRVQRNSLSYSDARKVSRELTTELGRESMFYTMSHANMERDLLEQRRDPAIGCATLGCAIENGKVLDSQIVIYGTVLQTGFEMTIETHLVHVGSREVVKSFSDDISSDLTRLEEEIANYVRKFLGLPKIVRAAPKVREEQMALPIPVPKATKKKNKPAYVSPAPFKPPEVLRENTDAQAQEEVPPSLVTDEPSLDLSKITPKAELKSETSPVPEEEILAGALEGANEIPEEEQPFELWPEELLDKRKAGTSGPAAEKSQVSKADGGGFKWSYVGIGALVAGGVGAGLLLSQEKNGPPLVATDDLPGPPNFP